MVCLPIRLLLVIIILPEDVTLVKCNFIFNFPVLFSDKKQILEMNLATAENILNLSGNDLKHQLCQTKPLTVLATILTSSLELNRVNIALSCQFVNRAVRHISSDTNIYYNVG